MPCKRCGNPETVEKHHIIFRSNGGGNSPDNIEDLCRACHDYQHTKESLIGHIIDFYEQLKRVNSEKGKDYIFQKIKLFNYRLEVLERENTVLYIRQRGYYPYWNDGTTHEYKTLFKKRCTK